MTVQHKSITPVHHSIVWMVDPNLKEDFARIGGEEDIRDKEVYSNLTYHLYKACLFAYMGSTQTGNTMFMALFVRILTLLKELKCNKGG